MKSSLKLLPVLKIVLSVVLIFGTKVELVMAQDNNANIQSAMEQLRKSNALPFPVPMMMQPPALQKWEPNTVTEIFPPETRRAMMQNMGASNPWSLRQVFSFMTLKMKAAEGLTVEEVVEAMDSRAIEENLKKSGHNQVWKEIEAKTGAPTPKFEILQYCDALVARMVLDYSPGGVQVFRARGLLHEPVVVTRSALDAVVTFIKEGVIHILEGLDHVLFVICLVLGAMHLKPLLWRVTGFTIGHSITLSLGFFGYVPAAAWFVPAVETGIALSIIYVAVVAVVPVLQQKKGEWAVVGVTGLIGLLHGLGFSFVLQNILQVTSPNIWQSLVAFNIGVELGQVLIVICTGFVFYLIGRLGARAAKINRYLVAGVCGFTALYWVIERGGNILANI